MPFWQKRKKSSVFFAAPEIKGVKKIRRPRTANWRLRLAAAGVFFVLAGLGYLIFWSPVFKIRNIVVEGAVFVPAEDVEKTADNFCRQNFLKIIPRDTLAVIPVGELKEELMSDFPAIAEMKIKKIFWHELKVNLTERETAAIWCRVQAGEETFFSATSTKGRVKNFLPETENCFFADRNGILFREAPTVSGTLQTVFYFTGQKTADLGQVGVNAEILNSAAELKKQARNFDVGISGFLLAEKNGKELTALTSEGWRVFFNPDSSPVSQIKVLAALLADEIKGKRAELEYVDLRLPNRAYYK